METIKNSKFKNGFSLIEMLIVISSLGLFVLIGSNLLFGTFSGGGKSEVSKEVRQNGEYALKTMEESIKNAVSLESCDSNQVVVKAQDNQNTTYKVLEDEENISHIASNSSYLTSNKVKVEDFSFDCGELKIGLPPTIGINFKIVQAEETDQPQRKSQMSFKITVVMRNPYGTKI